MSLLFRNRFQPEARADHPTSSLDELARRRGMFSDTGITVTPETAERHSTVFACRDLISRLVSTMPVDTFKKRDGTFQPVTPTVTFFDTPDKVWRVDSTDWLYQIVDQLLARGNAFGLVTQLDPQGYPQSLHLLSPSQVTCETHGVAEPVWKVDGKPEGLWPDGFLWHVPAYTRPGSPIGMSPIQWASLHIGIGLAAQRFGAQWFRDGAVPTATLMNDAEVTQGAAQLVKDRFMDTMRGNREPLVLGNGWSYNPVSVAAEESQFLETMKANVADVCRYFGVLPEEIGGTSGDLNTYANVESRNLQLLVRTIGPWVVKVERALSRLRPNGQFVKFNVDALLRLDTATRMKAYETAIRMGWMSVNDVRELEDRPRIDGGDFYLWPPGRMQLTEEELQQGADVEDVPDEVESLARANGHKEQVSV